MKIVLLFPKDTPCIYAVCFDDGDDAPDEFRHLFDLWSDVEYLEEFFDFHKDDLRYFGVSVEDAVHITVDEAEKLEDSLYKILLNPGWTIPATLCRNYSNLWIMSTTLNFTKKVKHMEIVEKVGYVSMLFALNRICM